MRIPDFSRRKRIPNVSVWRVISWRVAPLDGNGSFELRRMPKLRLDNSGSELNSMGQVSCLKIEFCRCLFFSKSVGEESSGSCIFRLWGDLTSSRFPATPSV